MVIQCPENNFAPDGLIERLPPKSAQGGPGRHKCIVCAYQKGLDAAGLEQEIIECKHHSKAPVGIMESLPENQGGPGRHKCAVCAYQAGLTDRDGAIDLHKFEDVEIIKKSEIAETEKARLVNARIGQGQFRDDVYTIEPCCRITGVVDKRFLIASHIKPWRDCSNEERLDPYNGLMLSPHVDKLFDSGFISFHDDGILLFCKETLEVLERWSVNVGKSVGEFNPRQRSYLAWHRDNAFLG